jgi:hypothetical protein
LLFIFGSECTIRKVQENNRALELNGTYQLLIYAGDINFLGENISNTNKNTEASLDASKKVGLEINIKKTKYMFMFHHQSTGQKSSYEGG